MTFSFFDLDDNTLKNFSKRFIQSIENRLTEPTVRNKLSNEVRKYVAKTVREAIGGKGLSGNTEAAIAFQPLKQPDAEEIVGRLGVGKGGRPNKEKLANAWRLLLPSETGRRTKSSAAQIIGGFSKAAFKSGDFGHFSLRIDLEAFYSARVSTYGYYNRKNKFAPNEDGLIIIEWMRDYIEGTRVEGYNFIKPNTQRFKKAFARNTSVSRTGYGFLARVPSKNFRIWKRPADPYDALLDAIADAYSAPKFKREMGRIIKRVLK